MAQLPLNTFKTKTALLNTGTVYSTSSTVYTAPVGVTSIILMAQVSNISTQTHYVSFAHYRDVPILPNSQGQGAQPANVPSYLVENFGIPPGDAANLLSGKLIVEQFDSVRAFADTTGTLQLVLSVLETANS
jgi:hypothetical protein